VPDVLRRAPPALRAPVSLVRRLPEPPGAS